MSEPVVMLGMADPMFARFYDDPEHPASWTPRHVGWPPPPIVRIGVRRFRLEAEIDGDRPGQAVVIYRLEPSKRRPR